MDRNQQQMSDDKERVAFVIFGVTGDLTHRKLIPALYELKSSHRLPEPVTIIGFARRDWDDQQLQEELKKGVRQFARSQPVQEDVLSQLVSDARYVQSSFDDPNGYEKLKSQLFSMPNQPYLTLKEVFRSKSQYK